MDWKTTLPWNNVLAIFQHNHICQDSWKNVRSTFKWMIILKSRGQGPKRWRTTGQICPILSTRIWTFFPGLENEHTFKCWSGVLPIILTLMIMLENCQNNISVYNWSPILGTKLYFCWNLMKPRFQSGTYLYYILNFSTLCILLIRNKSVCHHGNFKFKTYDG